jgi:hypothetical protein
VAFICSGLLNACGGGGGSAAPSPPPVPALTITADPQVTASTDVPLARSFSVSTSEPTSLILSLDDGNGHAYSIEFPAVTGDHDVAILGLRPDSSYQVRVAVTAEDGRRVEQQDAIRIDTAPLPADFPGLNTLASEPSKMAAGYTLLDAIRKNRSAGYLVILDDAGRVVWFRPAPGQSETERVGDGKLLTMGPQGNLIQLIDMLGNVHEEWYAALSRDGKTAGSKAVEIAGFHHDVFRIEETGTYLTSGRESVRQVDNYPVDESNPAITATVVIRDEPVIEFAADGMILARWDFLDMLKPTRIAFDATQGQPNATDWIHLNSIWHDPADDSILVSLRHQDAVVKFSRETGELIWILGPHDNWQGFEQYLLAPTGSPFRWQYHQHAAMVTSEGNILLFDNANRRTSPFTGVPALPASANSSRAVEYQVDESTMTVRQTWEWGMEQSGEQIYTPFVGDADELPNANVLIAFGGLCTINGVPDENIGACRSSARVIEVTRNGEAVFDISIDDPDDTTTGYIVYRSERLDALYADPDVVITTE